MFDAQAQRYRDQLIEPRPDALPRYWGVDTTEYSVLGLTPALIAEPVPADEIERHMAPPWTLWPSWTYVLIECAAAAGNTSEVGNLVWDIIERVYRVTTRRAPGELGTRPMPGTSPEFWPTDWRTYDGNDAYGWGATTANLLVRHLFGFRESRDTRQWALELAPTFPDAALERGRRFGLRRLNYRGVQLDLTYVVRGDGILDAELQLETAKQCRVRRLERPPRSVYASRLTQTRHTFPLQVGQVYRVELR